jgi:uncharacterized membrane protein
MSFSPPLPLHISAGLVGILSGAAARTLRKGSPRHVLAGRVFVISMLAMGASAVYLSAMKHQINNVFGGIVTIYMVSTAWLTARRREGETSIFDWIAPLFAFAVGAIIVIFGFEVATSPTGPKDGIPAGMYFFMGSVALLSAAGDVRVLLRGGVFGTQRIVRHLWRMCFALFMATASFFVGQGSKVFPSFILQTNVLFIPALLPLILMIFWLLRVRLTNAYKNKSMPREGHAYSVRT